MDIKDRLVGLGSHADGCSLECTDGLEGRKWEARQGVARRGLEGL